MCTTFLVQATENVFEPVNSIVFDIVTQRLYARIIGPFKIPEDAALTSKSSQASELAIDE
jgi:hypothetical protein